MINTEVKPTFLIAFCPTSFSNKCRWASVRLVKSIFTLGIILLKADSYSFVSDVWRLNSSVPRQYNSYNRMLEKYFNIEKKKVLRCWSWWNICETYQTIFFSYRYSVCWERNWPWQFCLSFSLKVCRLNRPERGNSEQRRILKKIHGIIK